MLLAVLALIACTDDDTFSTSTSNRLTFTKDTISLDTIFSKVPSVTQTFWVHNNSGNGIRCSSIKLKSGNQTGFRVNVNGVYLGEKQGYQISDEEVRKGDSLRVFVEVTTPTNNQKVPTLVTDDLIFTLESGVQQSVNLKVWSWDAEILKNVIVSHHTIIGSEMPTVIYGGIKVLEGKTLTIPAGKTLYFHDGAGIEVHGTLKCNGEAGKEVVLRGDRLDNMFDYLKYDGVSGQWGGISLCKESYDNKLTFTDIHSGTTAISCDSSDVMKQKLTMEESTIHNAKGDGIIAYNSMISLRNCQISNTLGACLAIYGGDTDVNNCTIAQFYPFDSNRGAALSFANQKDNSNYPIKKLDILNSIVTGYADDVIMGSTVDTLAANYLFDHCLLRTPEIKDTVKCRDIIWENVEDTTVAGWKNFKKVDINLLQYDFRLKTGSLAIDVADPLTALPTDRDAAKRDEKPDMGCFETNKENAEAPKQ